MSVRELTLSIVRSSRDHEPLGALKIASFCGTRKQNPAFDRARLARSTQALLSSSSMNMRNSHRVSEGRHETVLSTVLVLALSFAAWVVGTRMGWIELRVAAFAGLVLFVLCAVMTIGSDPGSSVPVFASNS